MTNNTEDQTNRDSLDELREKVGAWVAQAYVNGSLDAQSGEKQGYDVCTELIMELIKQHDEEVARMAQKVTGETSDGYHTFNELYEFRKLYNAALFNEWASQAKYSTYKSKLHSDGKEPFGGGWFIVGAQLPTGQITNHYELKDWDLFIVPTVPRGAEWDGHTPQDVAERLRRLSQEAKQ